MTFDDFADQVESHFKSLGWTEIQVAEFISPRMGRLIRAFKEGSSVLETGNLLKSTPPIQFADDIDDYSDNEDTSKTI